VSNVKDFAGFKNNGQAVPIIGQPFTVENIWLPCNAKLHCNCGGADVAVTIVNSESSACPSCQKVYNCAFNPQKNAVEFSIAVPEPLKVS
jgi:hypothetical protein